MDIWPIDFNKTLEEINKWFDGWKTERFGSDSLNPERYYKVTPDEKGRYLYGVAEGESLNDEKEKCDKVLELLLRIKQINDKLSGKALSQHLQWREREQLKGDRETLYNTFLDIVRAASEPQQIPQEFVTDKAIELFGRALEKGLIINDGDKYKWNDTASLYGYFVDKTSDFLNLRHSNNRLPWKKYEGIITNHSELLATARQAINDYKNKELPPPEGDDKVDDICR